MNPQVGNQGAPLRVGWAQTDITPDGPVLLAGQFHARVSEGVRDPVTVTALALSREGENGTDEHVVMVSCDLVCIPDGFRDAVRARIERTGGPDPTSVFLSATHTHTAPEVRTAPGVGGGDYGVPLDVLDPAEYATFAADRVAQAINEAWRRREGGAVAFGLGQAVVGHNRRWTRRDGSAQMYGNTNDAAFSHIEGCEDHSVNLLFTWDPARRLTGVVVNLACPSQVSESEFLISADFWHDTREELRKRLGAGLFVLAQCSAAGDQSPHHLIRRAAESRMLAMKGRTQRQELASRIAAAVCEVVPFMEKTMDAQPAVAHRRHLLEVPRRTVSDAEAREAEEEAAKWEEMFRSLEEHLGKDPQARERPRWYVRPTEAAHRARWYRNVVERHRRGADLAPLPVEIHVVRIGDAAIATNPFEYYLDYGHRIIARSPATQTFLVQLAGAGTYVPSGRAAAGGGYGAVAASTPVGPEGGDLVAEYTIQALRDLWKPVNIHS